MISYENGNTLVFLFPDGTKIRHIPDGEIPQPEHPESIDLKITDFCDRQCPFCYEHSSPSGLGGNLNHSIFDTLSPGTELAIGGGDPLSKNDLVPFLKKMANKKVICNLTVHCHSYFGNRQFVNKLCDRHLIHGLGLSVGDIKDTPIFKKSFSLPDGVIFHTIIGITPNKMIIDIARGYKVLLLGNKTQVPEAAVVDELKKFISEEGNRACGIYFDNLACNQLDVKSLVSKQIWEERYMGDDGAFTMFIDLVREKGYASSLVDRNEGFPLSSFSTIKDLFQKIRSISI
jgi:hypothetical protein